MTEVVWDKLFVPYTLKDKNGLPLETLQMRSMRLGKFCLNCPLRIKKFQVFSKKMYKQCKKIETKP